MPLDVASQGAGGFVAAGAVFFHRLEDDPVEIALDLALSVRASVLRGESVGIASRVRVRASG